MKILIKKKVVKTAFFTRFSNKNRVLSFLIEFKKTIKINKNSFIKVNFLGGGNYEKEL